MDRPFRRQVGDPLVGAPLHLQDGAGVFIGQQIDAENRFPVFLHEADRVNRVLGFELQQGLRHRIEKLPVHGRVDLMGGTDHRLEQAQPPDDSQMDDRVASLPSDQLLDDLHRDLGAEFADQIDRVGPAPVGGKDLIDP